MQETNQRSRNGLGWWGGVGGVLYRKYHSDPQKEETHPGSYK